MRVDLTKRTRCKGCQILVVIIIEFGPSDPATGAKLELRELFAKTRRSGTV
jgi:hypothetical protein